MPATKPEPTGAPISLSQLLASMGQEYVAGGTYAAITAVREALPRFAGKLQVDYGEDIYDRMMMDDSIASDMETLKLAILSDGYRILPRHQHPSKGMQDPDAEAKAVRSDSLADWFTEALMAISVEDVSMELLEGLEQGNRAAEVVLKPGGGPTLGHQVVKSIRGKPRENLAYVVSPEHELQGILVRSVTNAGMPAPGVVSEAIGPEQGFLPMAKFLVFTPRTRNGDPRGISILDPAYLLWFVKTQVLPDFFRYLKQFASPSVIGKTPEAANLLPKLNADGDVVMAADGLNPVMVAAETRLYQALLAFMNASVLVVPAGAEVDVLKSEGTGEAFTKAVEMIDRAMSKVILGSTRMVQEAEHGSKADGGVAQDVAGFRVRYYRNRLTAIWTDFARLMVELNFPSPEDRECAPLVAFSAAEQTDWAMELDAVSKAFASGFIHESQLPELDERLNLPERDMAAMALEKAKAAEAKSMAAGDMARVFDPAGGQDPKEKEEED